MRLSITKINILKFAKFFSIFGAIIGFLIGIIYILSYFIYSHSYGVDFVFSTPIYDFGYSGIIIVPIFYALIFYILFFLTALFYNLVSKYIGGIEFDLDEVFD